MRTRNSKKAKGKPPAEPPALDHIDRQKQARERAFNALEHLRLIQAGATITDLYAKFFPQEFADDPPDYSAGWGLMAHYDRFSELVDERLFPIYSFSDQDYDDPVYLLHRIAIDMPNNWLWYNQEEDYRYTGVDDHLHIVQKLVVSATDKEPVFPEIVFRCPVDCKFSLDRLRRLCKKQEGLIARVGVVADAILGNTGNIWLDTSYEEYHMSEMPTWGESQVRFLAKEYAEAKRLNREIIEFFKWCDSPGKVERVNRLLAGAWVPEKKEQERIRVRALRGMSAVAPQPLVVTLGGGL